MSQSKVKKGPIIIAILVIILIIVAIQFIYIVREDEQVVIIQFGQIKGAVNEGDKSEAGLHWKAPWVNALTLSKRIRRWDGDPDLIPTRPDNQKIFVDTTARWRIKDPVKYYEQLKGDIDRAAGRLDDNIDSAIRNVIRGTFFIQVVASDNERLMNYFKNDPKYETYLDQVINDGQIDGRDILEDKILEKVKAETLENFGIEILDVIIKRVDYSDANREAAYKRMIAERNKVATEKRSIGEKRRREILGETERYKREKLSEAYEIAEELKGEGDAEAAKIYAEAYIDNPADLQSGIPSKEDFYEFYKILEAYENISKQSDITISTDSDFFRMLKDMNSTFK